MLANRIAFKYLAENAIGETSPSHLQSTEIEIRLELIEEYPKMISPLPSLQVNVNVSASANAPLDLMNLFTNSLSNVISTLKGGSAFKSGTAGITEGAANIYCIFVPLSENFSAPVTSSTEMLLSNTLSNPFN